MMHYSKTIIVSACFFVATLAAYTATNNYIFVDTDGTNAFNISYVELGPGDLHTNVPPYSYSTNYVFPTKALETWYLSGTNWLAYSDAQQLAIDDLAQYSKLTDLKELDNAVIQPFVDRTVFNTNGSTGSSRYLRPIHFVLWNVWLDTLDATQQVTQVQEVQQALFRLQVEHMRWNAVLGSSYLTNNFSDVGMPNMPSYHDPSKYWMDDIYWHTNMP